MDLLKTSLKVVSLHNGNAKNINFIGLFSSNKRNLWQYQKIWSGAILVTNLCLLKDYSFCVKFTGRVY